MMLLEIACFNVGSAIAAAKAGANRIELCDSPADGGTTPSLGTVKVALEKTGVPVFPIVRPRGGNFFYDEDEFAAMLQDIEQFRNLGCSGIVTGILTKDGSIDIRRTSRLVQAAGTMEVTFHKAFDNANSLEQALEDVIATGCRRLLTSGQQTDAVSGAAIINKLIDQAGERIIIMPGGGLRSSNIEKLLTIIQAKEWHSGARLQENTITGAAKLPASNTGRLIADVEEIKKMKDVLTRHTQS